MSGPSHAVPVIRHYVPGGTENGGGIGRLVGYILEAPGTTLRHGVIDTRGPRFGPISLLWFLRALMRIAADAVRGGEVFHHLHIAGRGSTVRKTVLAHWARMFGVPYALHLHDYDYASDFDRRPHWQRKAIRSAFSHAILVIVLGRRDATTVADRLGVPEDRLSILRNCVPDPGDGAKRASSDVTILFLGRLCPRKGVPELIAALADPTMPRTGWDAVLAGDGPLDDYRAEIARLGLADRIRLTGWVDAETAVALRDDADILVLPSHAEGFAMAILEGIAHGLAVVATRVGAHDEALENERNSLLVTPGDVSGLAAALARLVSDSGLRDRLGQAGRALFVAQFGIEGYVRDLERLHLSALPAPLPA